MRLGCFIFFLLIASCKNSASPAKNSEGLYPLKQPVLYARYQNLPVQIQPETGDCKLAHSFKTPDPYRLNALLDLCAPKPQILASPPKNPWLIQPGIKSFHWEQDLQHREIVILDLLDADGNLMPSKSYVSKIGSRILIELKPNGLLPQDSVLSIRATLLDPKGKKSTVWDMPFKIAY